jgi:hypothetical protein
MCCVYYLQQILGRAGSNFDLLLESEEWEAEVGVPFVVHNTCTFNTEIFYRRRRRNAEI